MLFKKEKTKFLWTGFLLFGISMFLLGGLVGGLFCYNLAWDRGYDYAVKVVYYEKNGLQHPSHYEIAGAGHDGPVMVWEGR